MLIKLGDYCDIIKGNIGIQKAIPGGFPLVVTAEERLSHNEYQFDNTAVIIPLVSSTGHGHASLKRIHYQEGKFALGTILSAVIIRDETILNPRYLFLYLSYFKDHLLVPLMKGAANVTLSIKNIKTVEIPLPSMKRQMEIIDLEKNSYFVNDLKKEIQTQKQLISQLKQSILQEAIQGKLTEDWRKQNPNTEPASELLKRIKAKKARLVKEKRIKKEKLLPAISEDEIPFELLEGWVWCRLGEVGITQTGTTPSKNEPLNYGNFIPFIQPGNINENGLNLNCIFLSEKGLKKGRLIRKCSNLMVCIGSSAGKTCYIETDISCNQQINAITSIGGVKYKYLDIALQSPCFQKALWVNIKKGLTPIINKGKWSELLLPLPPLEEQKTIVQKVEALMQKCTVLKQEITQSEQHAEMLMQAVLKEAFEAKQEVVEV